MKINKRILGMSIAAVAATTTISTLAITLTSCSTSDNSVFYQAFNDPYKELNMYAKNLDANGFKLYDQKQLESNEYKVVDGFTSFTDAANKINNAMRDYVTKLAQTSKIKEFVNKNASVLFVKSKIFTGYKDDESFKDQMNNFYMMQPILYQQIYSDTSDALKECPGFGFKFPAPINSKSNSLFDDWYQIGAKQVSNSSNNSNIPWRMSESWKGTADFVFYLYDSAAMELNNVATSMQKIYNITKENENDFLIAKLLKEDAISKHIIPIDIQYMYNGIWDQVGSFGMDYLFAKIFNNIDENGNLKKFDVVGDAKKNTSDEVDQILENAQWNPYKIQSQTNENTDAKQTKTNTFGVARPAPEYLKEHGLSNYKNRLVVASYNIIAHTFSLGINPDYISQYKGNKKGYKYQNFMGYLTPFQNKLSDIKGDGSKYFFLNTTNFVNFVDNPENHIYAVGGNREKFGGDSNTKWPLESKSSNQSNGLVALAGDQEGSANPITPKVLDYAKPIFSEQNQSVWTQFKFPTNFAVLVNTQTGQIMTVDQWKNKDEEEK